MPSDLQHLQRYATTGDAHAFRELVQAHGAMVHATALRVTRDAAAAQDVAQETFLELARKAGGITQSAAAWLHRVAWNRACDVVRRESTRKRVEEAMAETWHTDREATWPDIEPLVDASLNELPNELREVLVLYFLEGRTQAEVARHLGKNQATVSRAIERGISALREALRSRGVITGAGLAALFTAQGAQAMPVAVQASLGKLSLTGIGTSSAIPAASVTTTLITMTATTKMLLITAASATLLTGWLGWRLAQPVTRPEVKEQPRTHAGGRRIEPPKLPAPQVSPPPPMKANTSSPVAKPEGPLARFFEQPDRLLKLTPAQLQSYLAANKRNAESLLAAMRLTGDMAFLREAARNFPNDTAVQLELAFRSGDPSDPSERRRALDALKQSDPDNALSDYLSALEHLRAGDQTSAFSDLSEASAKGTLDDYALTALQSAEEAYLAAGFTPVEAKAAAMMGLQRRQVEPLRELSKQLAALQKAYTAAGDLASAEAIRQMGHALGQQAQSGAAYFIDELVGMNIERQFLDPASAAARQQELKQRTDYIRSLVGSPQWEALMRQGSAAELTLFLDRQKLYGEEAAIRWLLERH